jgi:hypothetical protein
MNRRFLFTGRMQSRRGGALVAFALGWWSYSLSGIVAGADPAADAVAVGTQTQLLTDDRVIEQMTGVVRELGTVTKANGGRPLSFWRVDDRGQRRPMPVWQLFHTVYYDDARRVFRLWCRGLPNDARRPDGRPDWDAVRYVYCESDDGINFTFQAELQGLYSRGDYNLVVTFDESEADPEHRYRIGYDGAAPDLPNGACLAHSPDGIRWTPYNEGRPVTGRAADFSNQVYWDPEVRLYRMFTRTDYGSAGGVDERRGVRMMTNPDLKGRPADWTVVRSWQFDREGASEWKRRQLYMMTDWIHRGVHFALMSVYEWPVDYSEGTETDHFTRHERDINNVYIATSRDADHWDLDWVYQGKPFVPRGGNGAWDKDLLFPSSRIVTLGDKHWIYYGGCNERHGTPGVCLPVRDPGIGLAWLPLDRFVGLAAGEEPGTVVTRPFVLEGSRLIVNAEARQGEIEVGVLDADCAPLAGYSPDDAFGYRGVDELRLEPRWREHADLAELKGKVVRLEFRLRDATLYSFQVQ